MRKRILDKIVYGCCEYGVFSVEDIYLYLEEQVSKSTIYRYLKYFINRKIVLKHAYSPNEYTLIDGKINIVCKINKVKGINI